MAHHESNTGSVELAGMPPVVRSIIPELSAPVFESGRYVLDMRLNRTSEDDLFWEDEVRVTDNPDGVARAFAVTASTLAWINFFAKPEIVISHSDDALQHGDHYPGLHKDIEQQTLTGRRFGIGESHYVIDFDRQTGPEFRSHSQIVQEGEISAYMEEWLGRVLSSKNNFHPHHSHLQPFANWLRTKNPDNNYSSYYFDD
jgi:hypothetical protein